MVIDKNGILKILRSSKEEVSEHKEKGEDSILITTECDDFNKDGQIGNDSIDLRISNKGYILNDDYEYINTLSDENFSKYFEEVYLNSEQGYDLKPGAILFIGTVERIHLEGDLIGRVTGRSVFSRFGLSVHCTQDKFSSGINSLYRQRTDTPSPHRPPGTPAPPVWEACPSSGTVGRTETSVAGYSDLPMPAIGPSS